MDILKAYKNLFFGNNEEIAKVRMEICDQCTHLVAGICTKKCFCVMAAKSTLEKAKCPIGKW